MALAVALTAPVASFAANNIYFGPDGTEASINNANGTWINMWGPAWVSTTWDASTVDTVVGLDPDPAGADYQGSVYIQNNYSGAGTDSANMISPGNWWGAVYFDGSQYASIQLDFKYDTTSTIPNGANISFGLGMGYANQMFVSEAITDGSGIFDGRWHHLAIPINDGEIAVDQQNNGSLCSGVFMYDWSADVGTKNFWLANVWLLANTGPQLPVSMLNVTPATQGLTIWNASSGINDRNEVLANTASGLSWAGHPGASYTINLAGFPTGAATVGSSEGYVFFVPNAHYQDNAPDWNEADCMVLEMQSAATGGTATLSYKINELSGNSDYVTIATVATTQLLGNYVLTFTDDNNGTLLTPGGQSSAFTMGTDGTTYFTEGQGPRGSNPIHFNIYLGGQGNNTAAINQAVVYGSFTASGVPSAGSVTENFAAESALVHWSPGKWASGVGSTTIGAVNIVPAGGKYWVSWSSPAPNFTLQDTASLANPNWQSVSTYGQTPLYSAIQQLVAGSELQSPTTAQYFSLIQRQYNATTGSLLIAFPGQTFVDGTGVTGNPTTIADIGGSWTPNGPVYVYSVDATMHRVPSADGVTLYSNPSLGAGFDQSAGDFAFTLTGNPGLELPLVNGKATFNDPANLTDTAFEWGYPLGNPPPSPVPPTTFMVQVIDNTLQALDNDQNTFDSSPVPLAQ